MLHPSCSPASCPLANYLSHSSSKLLPLSGELSDVEQSKKLDELLRRIEQINERLQKTPDSREYSLLFINFENEVEKVKIFSLNKEETKKLEYLDKCKIILARRYEAIPLGPSLFLHEDIERINILNNVSPNRQYSTPLGNKFIEPNTTRFKILQFLESILHSHPQDISISWKVDRLFDRKVRDLFYFSDQEGVDQEQMATVVFLMRTSDVTCHSHSSKTSDNWTRILKLLNSCWRRFLLQPLSTESISTNKTKAVKGSVSRDFEMTKEIEAASRTPFVRLNDMRSRKELVSSPAVKQFLEDKIIEWDMAAVRIIPSEEIKLEFPKAEDSADVFLFLHKRILDKAN